MQFPFPYEERVHATARSIRVTVTAHGEVRLTIPRRVCRADARAFLASRVDWVLKALSDARAKAGGQLRHRLAWDGSDHIPYRGIATAVKFSPARLARPMARLTAEALTVFADPNSSAEQRTRVLKLALIREARIECEDVLLREAARMGLAIAGLRIADTRAQWGSCTRERQISLSWRLLLAPPEVLRYVAIHELCHIPHPDHSPRFWGLLGQQMPGFERHQAWLKTQGNGLHYWLPGKTGEAAPQPGLFDD